jgi:aminoglycoside 2'-N-acetyltransferase I
VEVFRSSDLSPSTTEKLRELLFGVFGSDFTEDDWGHTVGGWHAFIVEDDAMVAHAAVVPRSIWIGDRSFETGYVEGVATDIRRQGTGLGTKVMEEAGRIVQAQYRLGVLSTGRASFYARLGWEVWQGPTWVRTPSGRLRTVDEDGGIMILRTPRTGDVDRGAAISCEERPGDDW